MIDKRQLLTGLSGIGAFIAFPTAVFAHRQKFSLTRIIWTPDSRTLDVTHRFHMHDAETALAQAGIIEHPDLMSLKAKAQFALYTAQKFSLKTLDGADIPLELLGANNEGRSVYVYQQTLLDKKPDGLLIDCAMLRGHIDGQINNVDVNLSGEIRSLLFKDDDGPKKALA